MLPGMQPDAQKTAPARATDCLPPRLLDELCLLAQTGSVGLGHADFEAALLAIGATIVMPCTGSTVKKC